MKARERNPQKKTTGMPATNKKLLDVIDVQFRYSIGRNTALKLAHDAGAEVRIGRKMLRFDSEKLDAYIDSLSKLN